jgi:hypothetical protein
MYVIETMTPEGPHWYEGWNRKEKQGHVIQGFQWTPYFDDAYIFPDYDQVQAEFNKVSSGMSGAKIVPEKNALKQDSWVFIDELTYCIRAKYMKEGQRVLVSGYQSSFKVIKRGRCQFRLLAEAGYYIQIGVNSNKKVFVTLKPKKNANP